MRILIVEDEKEIADGICKILEKAKYQVDCVYDGISGLDYILSEIYDLVLLDVMLPKLNGFDIVKNIRSQGIYTPVIMLTAKSQVNDKITGLNMGADDYITKPFDAGELLARINARLRGNKEIKDGKIKVYDIMLDPTTYMLYKEEKSVKMSKTEYCLLEYLMMNKNIILSKEMIVNKVWGYEDDTEYNNIEVYISFLRKKLKFVNANTIIETKKGVGYLLCEKESENG